MSMVADLASAGAGAPNAAAAAQAAAANGVGAEGQTPPATTAADAPAGRYLVPEEYRTQEAVRKFMDDKHTVDPAVVLKSHIGLEAKLGRDKIVIPKTDDEYKEVYKALGCPEAPEKYEFKAPEKLPEGIKINPEGEKSLRNWAHANGLNQKQAAAAYSTFLEHQAAQAGEWARLQDEAKSKCGADLKREQGENYPRFENAAKAFLREYADEAFYADLETTGLANDPRLIRILGKAGMELLGDDKIKGGGSAGNLPNVDDVQKQIDDLYATKWAELTKNDHPDHARYARELQGLFDKKHSLLKRAS